MEGGFDASEETVATWARDRYRRLLGESQWQRQEFSMGATVAGQARYPLSTFVVDVRKVRVGDAPYERASVEELWDVKYGTASFSTGVFVPGYSELETLESIELYPVPTEGGDEITLLAAVLPVDLGLDTEPRIPRDFDHVIVEGCIADGLARVDERLPEADRWEGLFAAGVEKLRRRRNSRVGSGPTRIRVGR